MQYSIHLLWYVTTKYDVIHNINVYLTGTAPVMESSNYNYIPKIQHAAALRRISTKSATVGFAIESVSVPFVVTVHHELLQLLRQQIANLLGNRTRQ